MAGNEGSPLKNRRNDGSHNKFSNFDADFHIRLGVRCKSSSETTSFSLRPPCRLSAHPYHYEFSLCPLIEQQNSPMDFIRYKREKSPFPDLKSLGLPGATTVDNH